MKTSLKVLAVTAVIGSASIASTANAWWVPFIGDGYGDGNMSFNMSARGHGNGWSDYDGYNDGYGNGYGNGGMSFNMSARGHGNGWSDYDRYYDGRDAYRRDRRAYGPSAQDQNLRDRAPIERDGDQVSRQDGERARYMNDRYGYNGYGPRDYYDNRGYGRANGGFNFNMSARGAGDGYGNQNYGPYAYDRYYNDRGYEADNRQPVREPVPAPETEAELTNEG